MLIFVYVRRYNFIIISTVIVQVRNGVAQRKELNEKKKKKEMR